MTMRQFLGLLSPGGDRARLSSLIFHRVRPTRDELFPEEVDAGQFSAICAWVRNWFTVLPLDEAAERLAAGTLPPRALTLTFDDGYADNREIAAPLLQLYGLPCTFFIATGFLDGGRMWNDTLIESFRRSRLVQLDLRGLHPALESYPLADARQRRVGIDRTIMALKYLEPDERQRLVEAVAQRAEVESPTHLMMTSAQVKELRGIGMQIGAHTVSHPILRRLPRAAARSEIEASKARLEQLLGEPVSLFAYPNGKPGEDYSPESVELVKQAGFAAAVSTQWGFSTRTTDRFQLRRFTPWDRTRLRFGLRMAKNLVAA